MLNLSNAILQHAIVHQVGNATFDEELVLSKAPLVTSEEIDNLLLQFVGSKFRANKEYFRFFHPEDIQKNDIYQLADTFFSVQAKLDVLECKDFFLNQSGGIAVTLYETATHPNIKGSELIVLYLTDISFEDEVTDALVVFKLSHKQSYLDVVHSEAKLSNITTMQGFGESEIEKGCLILNTDSKQGFVVACFDKRAKAEGDFWQKEFLKVQPREDSYFHTKQYLQLYQHFLHTDESNEELGQDQLIVKGNQVEAYFKEREKFDFNEFATEVLQGPEIIDRFRDFKNEHQTNTNQTIADEFEINAPAVKTCAKYFKKVLKLDKNFHVYMHGKEGMVEEGFDKEKGMKFYKLFYKEAN